MSLVLEREEQPHDEARKEEIIHSAVDFIKQKGLEEGKDFNIIVPRTPEEKRARFLVFDSSSNSLVIPERLRGMQEQNPDWFQEKREEKAA